MSEKKPTLVLTGATGFIGKHIASYFVEKGWHVIALVRNVPAITKEKFTDHNSATWNIFSVSKNSHITNVLYEKYDLTSGELADLPDDIAAFIHAGYIKQENINDAFSLNKKAAEKLLESLRSKNVGAKLFLSSLSADVNAASVYGRQKAAIEELFLKENGTVIRAGLVLGDGGLFASMRNYLKLKKKIPLFGSGNQPLQTVYIDDLVLSIEQLILKKFTGKFTVACDETVPYREFYDALAKSLGVEPKFVRAPYWFVGFGITMANIFGKKLPVTKDNLLGLKLMKKIPSADDLKKIGVKLRDYKESFSELK